MSLRKILPLPVAPCDGGIPLLIATLRVPSFSTGGYHSQALPCRYWARGCPSGFPAVKKFDNLWPYRCTVLGTFSIWNLSGTKL